MEKPKKYLTFSVKKKQKITTLNKATKFEKKVTIERKDEEKDRSRKIPEISSGTGSKVTRMTGSQRRSLKKELAMKERK